MKVLHRLTSAYTSSPAGSAASLSSALRADEYKPCPLSEILQKGKKMTNKSAFEKIPGAIYYDTNTLIQIIQGQENSQFNEVLKYVDILKSNISIPSVVYKESLNKKTTDAVDTKNIIISKYKLLRKIINTDDEDVSIKLPENIEQHIEKNFKIFLTKSSISILNTPKIDIDNLVDMAVKKIPPFEEKKEKGFRDSVILLTIFSDITEKNISNPILVTNDNIFSEESILSRFKEKDINLIIKKSTTELKEYLESLISSAIKEIDEKEKKKVLEYLNTKKDEIFKFIIENAEVSVNFLKGIRFRLVASDDKDDQIDGTIKKVLNVRPLKINSFSKSYDFKDKELIEEKNKFLLSVSTEFELLVNKYKFDFRDNSPRISLSELGEIKENYKPATYVDVKEKVIRNICVQFNLLQENEEFKDFKLIKVNTY